MWVYQQPQNVQTEASAPAASKQEPPAMPAITTQENRRVKAAHRHSGQATLDCVLLAAAYLLGTVAAGILKAICDAGEREALNYYLRCWCGLFTLDGANSVVSLFVAEYFAAAGVVTILLFIGLSALGPMPVFFFMMLYGTGIGLLAAQLFAGITLKTFVAYILIAGVPAAVASACVCVFGSSAMQVCSRLQSFSFGRKPNFNAGPCAPARALVGQYALIMTLFLPLSGAATGLVYLANQLHLW